MKSANFMHKTIGIFENLQFYALNELKKQMFLAEDTIMEINKPSSEDIDRLIKNKQRMLALCKKL